MALSDELYFPLSRSVTAWMHLLRSFAINIIFGIFQLCNCFPVDVKVPMAPIGVTRVCGDCQGIGESNSDAT